MKQTPRTELWQRLEGADLVNGELPDAGATPWFVRVMLGIAGWIGALFILGFVGTGFAMVMQSSGAALVAASICCGGAFAIFRLPSKGDFVSQFGMATGIAGQALFAAAIFQELRGDFFIGYLLFAAVEGGLTLLMPNFVHRIFTTLGGVAALYLGLARVGVSVIALPLMAAGSALVWRREIPLARRADLWQPVGYGLALGLLLTATTSLFEKELLNFFRYGVSRWMQQYGPEIGTLLVILIVLWVIIDILQQLSVDPAGRMGLAILGCALLLLSVSFPAHGFAVAALLVLLGFAGGNRVLFGVGILAMASFISLYYYQMRETLIYKAMILAATGTILLLVRMAMRSLFPIKGGSTHA